MVPAGSGRVSPAPPYSGYRPAGAPCVYGTVTPFGHVFQTCSTWQRLHFAGPTTPRHMCRGLGWPAFARRYLRGHWFVFLSSGYLDVSVPRVTVPASRDGAASRHRVAPFGHLRIKGCLRLPAAFRSLPRPSSSLGAKASPIRPSVLPVVCPRPLPGGARLKGAPRTPWCARRPPEGRPLVLPTPIPVNELFAPPCPQGQGGAAGTAGCEPAARPPTAGRARMCTARKAKKTAGAFPFRPVEDIGVEPMTS